MSCHAGHVRQDVYAVKECSINKTGSGRGTESVSRDKKEKKKRKPGRGLTEQTVCSIRSRFITLMRLCLFYTFMLIVEIEPLRWNMVVKVLNTHKGVLQIPAPEVIEITNQDCSGEVVDQQHSVKSQCV